MFGRASISSWGHSILSRRESIVSLLERTPARGCPALPCFTERPVTGVSSGHGRSTARRLPCVPTAAQRLDEPHGGGLAIDADLHQRAACAEGSGLRGDDLGVA